MNKQVKELSVREQAEFEIAAEQRAKDVAEMKRLVRNHSDALKIVATLEAQIKDVEVRMAAGTN